MKAIYTVIAEQIRKELKELKWIDLNKGQLDVPYTDNKRPPVRYPCLLIDFSVDSATDLTDTLQACKGTLTLTYANDLGRRTEAHLASPGLEDYDPIDAIYRVLQGFTGGGRFNPLSRISQKRITNSSGLFVYRMIYSVEYQDTTNQ